MVEIQVLLVSSGFGCVLVLGVACSGWVVESQAGVHPHVLKHPVEVVFLNLAVGIAPVVFEFYIPNSLQARAEDGHVEQVHPKGHHTAVVTNYSHLHHVQGLHVVLNKNCSF